MNENLVPKAMLISKRIELVTKLKLNDEKYASENYQVMNYGIGGKIAYHSDSTGFKFDRYHTDAESKSRKIL